MKWEKWIANITILFILIGSGISIVFAFENWPFDQFEMYSQRQTKDFAYKQLRGVFLEGDLEREFALNSRKYLGFFDDRGMIASLHALQVNHPDRLPAALQSVLRTYHYLRNKAQHDGPPLVGVRLYETTWRLDSHFTSARQPIRSRLLAEHFERLK